MQIRLENVNYIYNPGTSEEKKALDDICLELGGDSFISIIGSTGSGKSTLIQLLDGLEKPSSGRITWDGEEIYGRKDEKKLLRQLRCRVGLTFQYPEYQLFEEDVYSDVAYGPGNLGLDKEEIDRRVRKALDAVGLEEATYRKSPFELSGGRMRRAAIAGMLAMEPEIMILDEPTAGLDPLGKLEILRKLKEIQQTEHVTVIVVSHSMEEVAEFADRVIALHDSRIIMDGPAHEVFRHYRELEDIGLSAPDVKYFMQSLSEAGANVDADAITVEEAVMSILKMLGK